MSRLVRPSDSFRIPNLLTKIPVGKGQVIYSPPNPAPAFGALPFQVSVNQIGQVTCDFNPQGVIVTNPYGFYIYFPDAETWAPEFYGNFAIPYAPYPGAIIRFDSTKDPFGNPQIAGPQIGGAASCTITTDLSQYTGGGPLGVTSGVPYTDVINMANVAPSYISTGWGQKIPYPNNHVIVYNGGTVNLVVAIGTAGNIAAVAEIAAGTQVDLAPIKLPYGWDVYLAWVSTDSANASVVAY